MRSFITESGPLAVNVSRAMLVHETRLAPFDGVSWARFTHGTDVAVQRTDHTPWERFTRDDGVDSVRIRPQFWDSDGNFVPCKIIGGPLHEQVREYAPLPWRRQERNDRHCFECLLAYQNVEVALLGRQQVSSDYPPLSSWWKEVEVAYGFYNPMPKVVAYSQNMFKPGMADRGYYMLLHTEWALSVATHLFYEACIGKLW